MKRQMRCPSRAPDFSLLPSGLGGMTALRSAGQPEPPPVFTEAEIFLELNDTDGDLGIHASIFDGGPWTPARNRGTS